METILIQNFKAIKNTAKREIKVANLTILMGEQATGKSTVAKLVYFFKKLPEEILDGILSNSRIDSENFEAKITEKILTLFRNLFGVSKNLSDFEVSYKYRNESIITIINRGNETHIKIIWPDDGFIDNLKKTVLPIYEQLMQLVDSYDDLARKERQRLIFRISQKVDSIFNYNQLTLYVPSSRNVVVGLEYYLFEIFANLSKSSISEKMYYRSENEYILLNFINHIRIIKNRFKSGGFEQILNEEEIDSKTASVVSDLISQVDKILRAKYSYEQSDEKLYYEIDNPESYVFLENSSSGQQEVIRVIQDIFLEVLNNKPVFRVYEEPESHLSPVGQLGIIQLIGMLANRNPDNQIIIPTHTPYLLYEINNMLEASRIVKDHPELRDEVTQILKPYYWLNLEDISAYQLNRDGEIEDAKDLEYQMVDGELFDRVTNNTSEQFEKLLKLQDA